MTSSNNDLRLKLVYYVTEIVIIFLQKIVFQNTTNPTPDRHNPDGTYLIYSYWIDQSMILC